MSDDDVPGLTDEQVSAKWLEIAPLIDKMAERIADPSDFPVHPGSSLFDDDQASSPYGVSHAVQQCLVSGVDHLHAAKSLVIDLKMVHASAVYSLVRGSLETLSAAYWILHPARRDERVERVLRWHARNVAEQYIACEPRGLMDEAGREERLVKLDAVAISRNVSTANVRAGYRSSTAVKYVEQNPTRSKPLLPWQLCSGFAHGRQWAILGVSKQEQHETADPGVLKVKLTSDLTRVLYPTLNAFHLLTDVVELLQRRSSP
ncbi:hypothetical protein [Mycolicibacterium aurum]|uniref:hypothetical protein n=1 Tax=Mycolicibacterium aurum TaxID=1791 RepID=UPI00065DE745|nr:hypothetical protein [Mycolicibacterium aurum]